MYNGESTVHRPKDQIHLSVTSLAFQKPELCGNCFISSFFGVVVLSPKILLGTFVIKLILNTDYHIQQVFSVY